MTGSVRPQRGHVPVMPERLRSYGGGCRGRRVQPARGHRTFVITFDVASNANVT
jgi:hypothetical protein